MGQSPLSTLEMPRCWQTATEQSLAVSMAIKTEPGNKRLKSHKRKSWKTVVLAQRRVTGSTLVCTASVLPSSTSISACLRGWLQDKAGGWYGEITMMLKHYPAFLVLLLLKDVQNHFLMFNKLKGQERSGTFTVIVQRGYFSGNTQVTRKSLGPMSHAGI